MINYFKIIKEILLHAGNRNTRHGIFTLKTSEIERILETADEMQTKLDRFEIEVKELREENLNLLNLVIDLEDDGK